MDSMENRRGDRVASLLCSAMGKFDPSQSFVKDWHCQKVQGTAKLNLKVVDCCQINFNCAVRDCVGQMSNKNGSGWTRGQVEKGVGGK